MSPSLTRLVPLGEAMGSPSRASLSRDEREAFMDRWEELAQQIGEARDGEQSVVEQLQDDRRRLDPEFQNWINDP